MMLRHASRRAWIWLFRFQRAEFYRDLADMFRRNEAMISFFEGEIRISGRTRQRARAAALRGMLATYQLGGHAGQLSHLLDGVVPRGDAMMLTGVDRADDKAAALSALAVAVEKQSAMRAVVLAHSVLPLLMLPLYYVLISVLSDVILTIDRSTPIYVKEELWRGTNGWARDVAQASEAYGPFLMALFVGVIAAALASLPRWRGPLRLVVEGWPVYGLYRDFQSGMLFTAMAMLLSNGGTLRGSLEDIAQRSSLWMRWHLSRVLRALDENPTSTLEAFGRGILSPYMLARATTLQRTAANFSDVLVELGTREGDRVLEGVRRAALAANVALVGLLLLLCTFMGLATLTVPGKFSSLMEPATLMELKQSHEADALRRPR
jgi:type II secretory pathway component PulF